MIGTDLALTMALGSLLGLRHAFEPDHLAAVTTLVSGERVSFRAALLGACWGLGHLATLIVVGSVLVILRAELPVSWSARFEFLVALMLIGLGVRSITLAVGGDKRSHRHIGRWTTVSRPLVVGAAHGLAGSGALAALALTMLPSTIDRVAYMILFGLASTLGMAAMSGLLGVALARVGGHGARRISLVVGGTSAALGIAWGLPVLARLF